MEKEELIFISYSSKDAALANQVVAYLEQNGYPCWIAPRNITSGGDYTDMINDSIHACRALVFIVTSRSVQSQWVKKELATAVSYNKTIIPFRTAAVQLGGGLQFMLNNVQWIDATGGNVASHFPKIISGIEQQTVVDDVPVRKARWALPVAAAAVLLLGAALLFWHPWGGEEAPVADSIAEVPVEPQVVVDTVVVEVPVPQAPAAARKAETKNVATKEEKVETAAPAQQVAEPAVEEPAAVVPETKKAHTPTAAELAAENYNRQFKKAKRLFDVGNYADALAIFTTLKYENPSDANLDAYISECRKHM